jgi:hypothetical protein
MTGMATIARWFDHKGDIIEAAWAPTKRATAYGQYDQLTHWVFGEQSETAWHQAITLCGKRVHEIPGRGEVTCAECLEAATE